jgi:hypothetical protein
LTVGCKKKPGEGGKAEIKGKIIADFYCDDTGELLETAAAPDRRVYISYGDNTVFDDDVRTSGTGEFSFKFLNPGNYTISVISECGTCPKGVETLKKVISVAKKEKDIDAGTINIKDYSGRACPANPYRGFAEVRGMLQGIFIDENNGDTIAIAPFPDERVYISVKGEKAYFENVRAGADGSFLFTRIPKGDFEIYAYSECPICPSRVKPEYISVSVTAPDEKVKAGTLQIIEYRGR